MRWLFGRAAGVCGLVWLIGIAATTYFRWLPLAFVGFGSDASGRLSLGFEFLPIFTGVAACYTVQSALGWIEQTSPRRLGWPAGVAAGAITALSALLMPIARALGEALPGVRQVQEAVSGYYLDPPAWSVVWALLPIVVGCVASSFVGSALFGSRFGPMLGLLVFYVVGTLQASGLFLTVFGFVPGEGLRLTPASAAFGSLSLAAAVTAFAWSRAHRRVFFA